MADSNGKLHGETGEGTTTSSSRHVSVLLDEVIEGLALKPSDVVLDGTLGGGGHARRFASRLGPEGVLFALDADRGALERAKATLTDVLGEIHCAIHFAVENFRNFDTVLAATGIDKADKFFFDLGLSSDQLNATSERDGRGFSFLREEPLLMTLVAEESGETLTAREVVNEWSEESLADVIWGFGEERSARKIARAIVVHREESPIETSKELADLIAEAIPKRGARIHPATKTFQAIRMAVNDELGALKEALEKVPQHIASSGRVAVISFHSHEDRIVKRTFRGWADEGRGAILTKTPITPSEEEVRRNPRSRSAKLRLFQWN